MESVDIKDISGNLRFSTPTNGGGKRNFYLMKEDYITLKFSVEAPVYFQLGDYCETDDGLFEVIDLVFPTQNKSTAGYEYELRLDAPYWKWKHKILFYDRQGNKEAAWNLTRNPDAHMSVVKSNLASLGYSYKGEAYDFSIDYSVVEDKPIFLQYSNTNIIDAITMIAEACGCEWWVVGNTIYLGKCELSDEPITFALGDNVQEMSRDKSDSTYATRIYAFGSTRNITAYYRKDLIFEVTGISGEGYIYDQYHQLKSEHFLPVGLISYFESLSVDSSSSEYEMGEGTTHRIFTGVLFEKESMSSGIYSLDLSKLNFSMVGAGLPAMGNIKVSIVCQYTKEGYKLPESKELFSGELYEGDLEYYSLKFSTYTFDTGGFNLTDVSVIINATVNVTSFSEGSNRITMYMHKSGEAFIKLTSLKYEVRVTFESGKSSGQSFTAVFNPLGVKEGSEDFQMIQVSGADISIGDKYRITGLKYDKIPSGWFTSDHADTDLVVEGIVEKRLMLPAGTPFIGDKNLPTEKVIEQVVVFDDIYPKRVGKTGTVYSHEYTETTKDDNGNVISEEKWDAYRFTDSNSDFHFSKDYVIKGRDLKVTFQSGALAGMTFNVWFNPYDEQSSDVRQDEKNPDGSWNPAAQVFEVVRNEDYGRKLPAGDMKPKPADEYILEGFDTQFVSDVYLPLAEQELKEKAQKYADKLKIDPSVYNNKMFSYEDNRYANLPIGRKVNLVNKTYFENGRASRIVGFEKNLDIPYDSPVYMVGESQTYSRIGSLEDKVDALTFKGLTYTNKANGGGGGNNIYIIKRNDNTQASDNNVYSAARSQFEFLNKNKEDIANALIKFLKGIYVEGGADIDIARIANLVATEADINILDVLDRFTAKDGKFSGKLYSADYVQAMLGWIIHADGSAEMKGLRLREFLEVPELRYNRVSVITGEQWSAPGGGIIESVDAKNCILYLKLEPGELAAVELDDICKGTFNNDTGFQTAFFRITEKLGDSTFKYAPRGGYEYNPQKAMHFVAYGNFTNKDRQASAYITRKYTRYLRGVNTWEISKNMITMQFGDLSNLKAFGIEMEGYSAYLKNIYLTGTIKQLSSDGVTETPVPAFKGEWKAGTYYPNDEVTHEGSTWLCISEKKTTQEPTEDATDWLETSAKGKDAIVVEIFSSNGNIFRNGAGGTTLTAQVRKGDKDVTEGIPPTRFSWEKESSNADTDTIFNETHVGHGPALEVTPDDVWARATFNCIVSL